MADLVQFPTSVVVNVPDSLRDQKIIPGQIGEAVGAGAPLYLDKTLSPALWKLALASGTLAQATVEGFAAGGGAINQWIGILKVGNDLGDFVLVNLGAGTLVVGTEYFLSKNAGKIGARGDLVSTNFIVRLGVVELATGSGFRWKPDVSGTIIQVP